MVPGLHVVWSAKVRSRAQATRTLIAGVACLLSGLYGSVALAADGDIGTRIARDFATKILGKTAASDLLSKARIAANAVHVVPAECEKALEGETLAEGDSTTEGLAASRLWSKVGGLAPCQTLGIQIDVPDSDVSATLFFTGIGSGIPVGHVALSLGANTLNSAVGANRLFKDFPVLNTDTTSLRFTRAVAVLSLERAQSRPANLATALREAMAPYADGSGNVTLEQGVNFYGTMQNPKAGPFADIVKTILPGIEESPDAWKVAGSFGGDFIELLLKKAGSLAKIKAPDYKDKTSLGITLDVPAFTPFPFNRIGAPEIVQVRSRGTRFGIALARSQSDGSVGRSIVVSVRNETDYTLLGKLIPIAADGRVEWDGKRFVGGLQGEYALPGGAHELLPGIQITHLIAEGGIAVEPRDKTGAKTGKAKGSDKALSAGIGLRVRVGDQNLKSRFTINLKEQGGRFELTDAEVRLGGAGVGGAIRLAGITALRDVPLINEWTLDEGVVGIAPRRGKAPDLFIAGGATWSRTNLGGRFAAMSKGGKLYLLSRLNRFSFAGLLPPQKEYEQARNVLTVLSVPEAMVILTNDKSARELKTADMPEPLQDMFDGFVSAAAPGLSVYGDGLTVTTRLVLPDGGNDDLSRAFRQIGLTGFSAKNPLLVSGSIGGLASGKLKLSVSAALPVITLPKQIGSVANPLANVVRPGPVSFYMALEAAAAPAVEIGMGGKLGLNVPDLSGVNPTIPLDMDGKLFLKVDTTGTVKVQVAGHLDKWDNAFGIAGLTYLNPAITAAVAGQVTTTSVGVQFGVGGDTQFTARDGKQARFAADAFVGVGISPNPPYVIPQAFGLNLGATEISPDSMILVGDVLLRGVLAGPLSQALVNAIPDPKAKAAARDMQNRLKNGQTSLAQLIQADKIPLPLVILKKAQGEQMARLYFATPGAEIPGREASGLAGIGLLTNAAVSLRMFGRDQELAEAKLNISPAGLELYGKLPVISLGALSIGKADRRPTVDIAATTSDLPHFRVKGYLELKPVLQDDLDFEVSKDSIHFLVRKKLAGVYELDFNARTNGSSLTNSSGFLVDAKLTNNIDTFLAKDVLPRLGVPKPVIDGLGRAIPVEIKQMAFHGDLVDLARGGSVTLSVSPQYFGDPRRDPPIVANIQGVTWDNPLRLFENKEVARVFIADFVDYLASHPKNLPPINLGLIAFTGGKLGGFTEGAPGVLPVGIPGIPPMGIPGMPRMGMPGVPPGTATPVAIAGAGGRPQGGAKRFVISGGLKLPLTSPQAQMSFDQDDMLLTFSDKLLGDGLLNANFEVRSPMQNGVPVKPTFEGKVTGDANAWLRKKVTDALRGNKVGEVIARAVAQDIAQLDLVTITNGSFNGDFEAYFLRDQPVNMKLEIRVLGKYQNTDKRNRVKTVVATVPVYANPTPGHVDATIKALAKPAEEIVGLLVADALAETAGTVLEPVANIFKDIAAIFKDLNLAVAHNGWKGKIVRLRKQATIGNDRHGSDVCVGNFGSSGSDVQLRVGPCDGSKNQMFEVSYDSSGRYMTLRNLASGNCLNIRGTQNGGPVTQFSCGQVDSMLWSFAEKPSMRGTGMLVNRMSRRCMDLKDGNTRTGQEVHEWDCSVINLNQYFWFEEIAPQAARAAPAQNHTPVVGGGVYSLQAVHSGRCLDNYGSGKSGQQTVQADCNDANINQQWQAEPVLIPAGHFRLKSVRSGKCLDVDAGVFEAKNDGRKIQQWDCHVGNNQKWQIVGHADGTVSLRSVESGKCVDLAYAKKEHAAPFFQYPCHWGANQRFKVKLVR